RSPDDRPGANDGNLDRQLIQVARLRPGQKLDLGPAFNLKDAHGIARRNLVVDRGIVKRDATQIKGWLIGTSLGDELDALLDQREHTQGEEVDFDKAGVLA